MAVKARAEISLVGVSDGAKGDKGDTGAAGNGIKSTAITYQASTSNTTAPTGTWSSTIPSVAAGSYLWTKTVITYTNGTTSTSYSVAKQGATGATGAAGADGKMLYGTCATAAGTAAKVATATGFKLVSGTSVSIKFTYNNTAASPTLNINSLGAKAIYTNGTRYAYWAAGATVTFVYDGTNFQVASVPVYANTATVGNPASGNVYIDSDSVDIRNGSTVNSTFSTNLIELGKNSTSSVVKLCGGEAIMQCATEFFNISTQNRGIGIFGDYINTFKSEKTVGTVYGSAEINTSILYDNPMSSAIDIKAENLGLDTNLNNAYIHVEASEADGFRNESGTLTSYKQPYTGRMVIGVDGGREGRAAKLAFEPRYDEGSENDRTDATIEFTSGDIVRFNHDLSNNSICFGVGAGGTNRGIWSSGIDDWLFYFDGTDIRLRSSRGGQYIPYYKKGDSISGTIYTAGHVTDSGKSVRFFIQLDKPGYGVSSITASSVNGFQIRQNNKYCYGSSSTVWAKPASYGVEHNAHGIYVRANFSSTTNVTNNDAIGIQWSGKITFG